MTAPVALGLGARVNQRCDATDELADTAALALIECRALAADAEEAQRKAREARDAAAFALSEAGWTVRKIAAELDCSHTLAHRMVKAHRDRVWGGIQAGYSATPSVAELAVEYRIARHAQELRAELCATGGYATELAGFYGKADRPAYDDGETPLVWASWLAHRSAMLNGEG